MGLGCLSGISFGGFGGVPTISCNRTRPGKILCLMLPCRSKQSRLSACSMLRKEVVSRPHVKTCRQADQLWLRYVPETSLEDAFLEFSFFVLVAQVVTFSRHFQDFSEDPVERVLERDALNFWAQKEAELDLVLAHAEAFDQRNIKPVLNTFSWRVLQRVSQGRKKLHKYGSCPEHGKPRRPWIGLSGPKAGYGGYVLKVCSLFFRRHDTRGTRLCWHRSVATAEEVAGFPKSLRDLHSSLRVRLQRAG